MKFEILMKYWPGGYYIIMNSMTRVTGDRTLMTIGNRYNFWKLLALIATEWVGSTDPGETYLFHLPDKFLNFVCTNILCSYFNAYNDIGQHNKMWQYYQVLYKYWAKHSCYFRIGTTPLLGVGISDKNILFCNEI